MLILSACGQLPPLSGDDKPSPTSIDSEVGETIAPLEMPPGFNNRPPLPGQSGNKRDSDGLPVMMPARGLNTDLFAEEVKNTDDRFERVENAVLELRQDFDAMMPSLIRLIAIEKDINALVGQLETIVSDPNATQPQNQAATPQASPPTQTQPTRTQIPPAQEQTPVVASGNTVLQNVRTGIHKGKARLVLDISAKSSHSYELDETEGLLLITLPDVRSANITGKTALKSPSIKSWNVETTNDGKGSIVIVELQPGTKINKSFSLAGNAKAGRRIVFDMF